ncbi:hypothetical protein U0070_017050, partial [Myodes glareolus]
EVSLESALKSCSVAYEGSREARTQGGALLCGGRLALGKNCWLVQVLVTRLDCKGKASTEVSALRAAVLAGLR